MNKTFEQSTISDIPASLVELQQGRAAEALIATERSLRADISFADQIGNPRTGVLEVGDFAYDIGLLAPVDVASFEALGLDVDRLLTEIGEGGSRPDLEQVTVGGSTLHIDGYGSRGVTLRLSGGSSQGENKPNQAIRDRIVERFQESPGHREMAVLNQKLNSESEVPRSIETGQFDLNTDALATTQLLQDIGLFVSRSVLEQVVQDSSGQQLLQDSLENGLSGDVSRDETDAATVYRWGKGVVKTLTIEKDTGLASIRFEQHQEDYIPEVANQSMAESVSFVYTECASELSALLDDAGLMFSPSLQSEMTRVGQADRYGSVYTQISRELAKWVDSSARVEVAQLFIGRDGHDDEQQIAERILAMDTSQLHDATRVIIEIAQDVLRRSTDDLRSDLPVTESTVEIRNSACFDVAGYYLSAPNNQGLHRFEENGVQLIEKTHGGHTFLLAEPIVFNGVNLPKGSLMTRVSEDSGWAFLRLTPFVFDRVEDQLATGSELAKAYVNESQLLERIGKPLIDHLSESAM